MDHFNPFDKSNSQNVSAFPKKPIPQPAPEWEVPRHKLSIEEALRAKEQYFLTRGCGLDVYREKFLSGVPLINPEPLIWHKQHSISTRAVFQRWGLDFTLLDPQGNCYTDRDGAPYKFVRWLGHPLDLYGRPLTDKEIELHKVPKCAVPYGRTPVIHFPALAEGLTYQLAAQMHRVLIHVESPWKAELINAVTPFLACAGNGVWGFLSTKKGMPLIHAGLDLDFKSFVHVLLFDANTADPTKPQIANARTEYAYRLRNILNCMDIYLVDLPSGPDGVFWGPDDYINLRKVDEFNLLITSHLKDEYRYQPEKHFELVTQYNSRATYVLSGNCVSDKELRDVISLSEAKARNKSIKKEIAGKRGGTITILGHDAWEQSIHREFVHRVGYRYMGEPTYEVDGQLVSNTYLRSGIWPEGEYSLTLSEMSDDARLIIEAVNTMLGTEEHKTRFWSYLRFVKFTSKKPVSYIVLRSIARGVGKGFSQKLVAAIIGPRNCNTAGTESDLLNDFNANLENCRAFLISEFKPNAKNITKLIAMVNRITGDKTLRIEPKGVDAYEIESNIAIFIATNEDMPADGLDDRRLIIIDCDGPGKWNTGSPEDEARWNLVHSLVDGAEGVDPRHREEVLNEVAYWLQFSPEIPDVNYSTFRPPRSNEREERMAETLAPWERAAYDIRKVVNDEQESAAGVPRWRLKRCYPASQIQSMSSVLAGIPKGPKLARVLETAGWFPAKMFNLGDSTQSWRVGSKKTGQTVSTVYFPCREAAYEADGRTVISDELAGSEGVKEVPKEVLKVADALRGPGGKY